MATTTYKNKNMSVKGRISSDVCYTLIYRLFTSLKPFYFIYYCWLNNYTVIIYHIITIIIEKMLKNKDFCCDMSIYLRTPNLYKIIHSEEQDFAQHCIN